MQCWPKKAERYHVGFEHMPTFGTLHSLLGLNFNGSQELLKKFSELDKHKNGELDIEEFAEALQMNKDSQVLHDLFDLFDSDHCGKIDFKEFVVGLSLLNDKSTPEKRLKIAFEILDEKSQNEVDSVQFGNILKKFAPNLAQSEIDSLFQSICCDSRQASTSKIHLDDFLEFFKKNNPQESVLHKILFSPFSDFSRLLESNQSSSPNPSPFLPKKDN